jgi:hypothetical protein
MKAKILPFVPAAGLLLGSPGIGFAQSAKSKGASGYSPGDQFGTKGSVLGSPGASGYAPGQQGLTGRKK